MKLGWNSGPPKAVNVLVFNVFASFWDYICCATFNSLLLVTSASIESYFLLHYSQVIDEELLSLRYMLIHDEQRVVPQQGKSLGTFS